MILLFHAHTSGAVFATSVKGSTFPSRKTLTFSSVPTCSMYLRTMTSQNFSSSSMVQQMRSVCSQAMSVEPEPPKPDSGILLQSCYPSKLALTASMSAVWVFSFLRSAAMMRSSMVSFAMMW